jgi:hypothetical protein
MFSFDIYSSNTSRTEAALYGCTICPPPGEDCPDDGNGIPTDADWVGY